MYACNLPCNKLPGKMTNPDIIKMCIDDADGVIRTCYDYAEGRKMSIAEFAPDKFLPYHQEANTEGGFSTYTMSWRQPAPDISFMAIGHVLFKNSSEDDSQTFIRVARAKDHKSISVKVSALSFAYDYVPKETRFFFRPQTTPITSACPSMR